MQFNITFKTIFEYVLKKLVLCIQIRYVSTEKTTRIASRASCLCICLCIRSVHNVCICVAVFDVINYSLGGHTLLKLYNVLC